jgi:hypothetical protein
VRAVDQWRRIEETLGDGWDEVRLRFVPEDGAMASAAAVLAPLGPGRTGNELRLQVTRHGGGPDRLRNLFERLDRKRVWGELELVDAQLAPPVEVAAPEAEATTRRAAQPRRRRKLVEQWDEELAKLPPGSRELLVELDLDSTDFIAQAALLGAPLNPARIPGRIALRFRASERGGGGYGASLTMARRSLEQMDAQDVTGELTVPGALSDVDNVYTQGPVWRIAGRSV